MLWVPLRPKAPKQPGNERGNPNIKVDTILAIWRDSVPEETRKQWLVADPAAEDRVTETVSTTALVPVQNPAVVPPPASRPAEPATVASPAAGHTAALAPPNAAVAPPAAPAVDTVPAEVAARPEGN